MKNEIALFMGGRSLSSAAIQLGTKCPIVHAAGSVNGRWYHASEQLRFFGLLNVAAYHDRMAAIYTLPDNNGDAWVDQMTGIKYDWPAIYLWLTGHPGSTSKMYCFEGVKRRMALSGIEVQQKQVTGCDIHAALTQAGITPRFGKFGGIT